MKKLLTIVLSLVMVMSMTAVSFADEAKADQNASFTKTYKITNAGTSNPEETFTFAFTADSVTDSNANLTKEDMPAIPNATVKYDAGTATTTGLEKTVDVALADIQWPGVGVYTYKVNEVAGTTAGVTYDSTEAYLKVTVAYDQGTDTYYTAFVTLNLADANGDGITDEKIAGFTNEYTAGNLSVTKTVSGNLGDQNAYFQVTVSLEGETGKTYAESYDVTGGTYAQNPTSVKVGESTTFFLKHGETITIANLPYGVTYSVVEADYTSTEKGGYDDAKYSVNGADAKISSVSEEELDLASESVEITNNKGVTVDTGMLFDNGLYIVLLAGAVVAAGMFFMKRRQDDYDM